MLKQNEKGKFHLTNGLRLNATNKNLLEELFPVVWDKKIVQNVIAKHLKS